MTLTELARDVVTMLDGQKAYFTAKHHDEKQRLLVESKQRENRLRKACEAILGQEAENLFRDPVGGES
jgi:hypothetical protein